MVFEVYHASYVFYRDCNTKVQIGMSGQQFLKFLSKSTITIMSKLQIETLKSVSISRCFAIPELFLSDQITLNND